MRVVGDLPCNVHCFRPDVDLLEWTTPAIIKMSIFGSLALLTNVELVLVGLHKFGLNYQIFA